jgi:hypothetical protein
MSAASPVPCRTGKNRVKIFLSKAYDEKSNVIIGMSPTLGKNRRRGREPAGKLKNRRMQFGIR